LTSLLRRALFKMMMTTMMTPTVVRANVRVYACARAFRVLFEDVARVESCVECARRRGRGCDDVFHPERGGTGTDKLGD